MTARDYDMLLAKQLVMTEDAWATLQTKGLTSSQSLKLDFTYLAKDKESALKLSEYLEKETDYEVCTYQQGNFLKKKWFVTGATQNTSVDLDILKQWVTWMVVSGMKNDCAFDGWGTEI